MVFSRRIFGSLLVATSFVGLPVLAQDDGMADAQSALVFGGTDEVGQALRAIASRGNPDMAAALILALRYTRTPSQPILQTLRSITGDDGGEDWFDWMIWQELHPEIVPHPAFAEFTRSLFLQIDPNFADFLKPEYLERGRMGIRIEEIAWGGVAKDGIPSLDRPAMISADSADYLHAEDLVFGVSINGDIRAYPLRIMGWHEMFNDVIGGVPVALAYCTLCGSGILFETDVDRARPLIFGSSGFLYRSNKLMFDRETNSLWNQFTGRPVVGPLVGSGIELRQRPVVITTWENWRAANPQTTVLSLKTGHSRDYGSGVVYNEYFAAEGLMFPAAVDQSRFRQKDYVFGIRTTGAAKAWPLSAFMPAKVINDQIGDMALVLLGDAETRSVRAYERGILTFTGGSPNQLRASDGSVWTVDEEALTDSRGRKLLRIAGHIAYWFAWDGYVGAKSEIYNP